MSRKTKYDDNFLCESKEDDFISSLLKEKKNDNFSRLKRILINVIKGELTETQHRTIMLYYFKEKTMQEIADETGVSVQAVSATIARAKKKIYNILKYYI